MDVRLAHIRKPGLAQKTLDRLRRGFRRRPLDLLAHVLRARGHAAQVERQPARRPVFAGGVVGQPGLDQTLSDHLPEVAGSLALHAGGDLFRAKFEKQIGHGSVSWVKAARA
jgi:hypothetical protein